MAEERINGDFGLRLAGYFLRYSPVVAGEGKDRTVVYEQENRKVIIRNPVDRLYPWKLFLYMLWKGKKFEEGKDWVEVEVDLQFVRGLIRKPRLSILNIALELGLIRDVEYLIVEKKDRENQLFSFRIFPEIEIREKIMQEKAVGVVRLYVDRDFMELCKSSGLFVYMPFLEEISSLYSFNLFMFFSVRQDSRFREEVLLEKSGLVRKKKYSLPEKRRLLKKALDELVDIGFIKGWHKEENLYHIERYSQETLRARATQKAQELVKKVEEFWQEVRQKQREAKRLQRQKRKASTEPVDLDF